MATYPSLAIASRSSAPSSRAVAAKPFCLAALTSFLARPSAVPVCEAKRTVRGGFDGAASAGAGAISAAKKPLSQARWTGVNGASSGMSACAPPKSKRRSTIISRPPSSAVLLGDRLELIDRVATREGKEALTGHAARSIALEQAFEKRRQFLERNGLRELAAQTLILIGAA